jgi:glycosyltransferase involved in cell wall biosynthesis
MPAPLVSVLMTAYNREKFIAEAIESVLGSRFADFELIVVDDRSTDGTLEIARRYTKDPRVRLEVNEKNLGDYPNRNRVATYARGKYLKYVDSDDVLYAHGLEVMVRALEKYPEAGFGLERPEMPDQPYPAVVNPVEAYREHFLKKGLFGCGPSGALIRADRFRAVGGFREMRMVGDLDLWLRLGARYPTVKFPRGAIWWRCHEGQQTNTETAATEGAYFQIVLDALNDPACPLGGQEKKESLQRARWRLARKVWHHALRRRRPAFALEMFRGCKLNALQLLRGLVPWEPTTSR